MKARGERIVIFGDSLSHPGSDSGPTQSTVTSTSARRSSAPGDLLASLLLEQGAEAVMLDAKVSRSAYNYWSREPTQKLMGELTAFRPTQIVVMLGTNDIGLSLEADRKAFEALRDAFKGFGAEVWAVGPFTYVGRGASLNPGAEAVFKMIEGVFGKTNTIDGRPLSINTDRSSDGVHFTPTSAEGTAQAILAALLAKNPFLTNSTWLAIAAGVAGALGVWGIIAYNRGRTRSLGELPPAPDDDIEDIAEDATKEDDFERARAIREQLSPDGKRKLRKQGEHFFAQQATHDWSHGDGLDPTLPPQEALDKLVNETLDPDFADTWAEQNADAIDEHLLEPDKAFKAWRSSFVDKARASRQRLAQGGLTALRERNYAPDPRLLEGNPWIIDAVSRERPELRGAELRGASEVAAPLGSNLPGYDRWLEESPHTRAVNMMRDPDPSSMSVVEDLLLEKTIKLREIGRAQDHVGGTWYLSPLDNDPRVQPTTVSWKVEPFSQGEGQSGFWTELNINVDGEPVTMRVPNRIGDPVSVEHVRQFGPSPGMQAKAQTQRQRDALREKAIEAAVADAWAAAQIVKRYISPELHPVAMQAKVEETGKGHESLGDQIKYTLQKRTKVKAGQNPYQLRLPTVIRAGDRNPVDVLPKGLYGESETEGFYLKNARNIGRETAQKQWDETHGPRPFEPDDASIAHDALVEGRNDEALATLEISTPPPWGDELSNDAENAAENVAYLDGFYERLKSLTQTAAGLAPSFHKLVRDPEPDAMEIAANLALEKGWKISEMTGGKRHGTIEMSAPGGPPNEWRMVQWHTPEAHRQHDPINEREVNIDVMLGKHRIERKQRVKGLDAYATKVGAANAWAVAKAIKALPLDVDKATLEKIIDKALDQDTMVPEELFGTKPKRKRRVKLTGEDVLDAAASTFGAAKKATRTKAQILKLTKPLNAELEKMDKDWGEFIWSPAFQDDDVRTAAKAAREKRIEEIDALLIPLDHEYQRAR